MTTEDYLKRMAELGVDRAALETGIPDVSFAMIRKTRLSPLLPDWRKNRRKVGRKARTK